MSTRAEAVERCESELLDLTSVFDEPVAREEYPLALLALGHRTRTLFRAFLELRASAVPVAARTLIRPMLEINALVRFLRKNPALHVELWQAEGDRNTVTMNDEIREWPSLQERIGTHVLDDEELEERRAKVHEARKLAGEAGLPDGSAVLPSIRGQLKVIDEESAWVMYITAYRTASWDVHVGPRTFLIGTFSEHKDGTVSYAEPLSAEQLLPTRALVLGIVASTVVLITGELRLAGVEQEASDIITTVMEIPPSAPKET
jgi:hypothetical protein